MERAGVTTTAGGLVTGKMYGNLLVLDVATGEVLKSLHAGAMITCAVYGKQYIDTGTASGFFRPGPNPERSSVVVQALPI